MLPLQELLEFLPAVWAHVVPGEEGGGMCWKRLGCPWRGKLEGRASSPEKVQAKRKAAHMDEVVGQNQKH